MLINAFAVAVGDDIEFIDRSGDKVSGRVQTKPSRVGGWVMIDLGGTLGDFGLEPYAEVTLMSEI